MNKLSFSSYCTDIFMDFVFKYSSLSLSLFLSGLHCFLNKLSLSLSLKPTVRSETRRMMKRYQHLSTPLGSHPLLADPSAALFSRYSSAGA